MGQTSVLGRIVEAWQQAPHLHSLKPGATEAELSRFEERMGWQLPAEWRELYLIANGASLLKGNVCIYPLEGCEFSLAEASAAHRAWNWPIPDQLCLAGDNGAG